MSIIEKGECRIEFLNHKGLGVGFTELGEVALPYTLVGELVAFERHSYRGKSNCILTEIIEPSTERQVPKCQYFTACGGCLLQHLPNKDYNEFKYQVASQQIVESQNITTTINPVLTVPPSNRRRANLEVVKKNEQIFLGFHRFRSHQIININQCPALLPQLSNLIVPLKQLFHKVLEHRQKAQIFITNCDNGVDITITIQEQQRLNPTQRDILLEFAKKYNITRLIFRYRKSLDIIQQIDKPYIIFGKVPVEIDAYSFLQASKLSDQILQDLIFKYLLPSNQESNAIKEDNKAIVDLFCGRDTYTLPLSDYFKVEGFEFDNNAIESLKKAINHSKKSVVVNKRDLFTSPLAAPELSKYDYCIINPPRAGAGSQCMELANSNLEKIIYVSCNPESFASDAKIITGSSYKLVEVSLVDQFYWSPHLELVGFFQRK
jgi:23S rRNA (uracil1939-C5)-methyltransferase